MGITSEAQPTARDFLLALLLELTSDRNFEDCFKAAHREVHQFFWELKRSRQSRAFVEELLFDTNGSYPHSEQIDELLQELQLAGVLSRPNPTYRYNDIAIKEYPSAAEFRNRLSPDDQEKYDVIVTDFKRELGVRAAK